MKLRIADCGLRNWKKRDSAFRIPHSAFGITLVELLVVMGVIGIVVGMSVPALVEYGQRTRLKTATRQVLGYLSLARSRAISARAERQVAVDGEHGELRMLDPVSGDAAADPLRLPSNLSVELTAGGEPSSDGSLTFRPSGALVGRSVTVVLGDGRRERAGRSTAATGAVVLQ